MIKYLHHAESKSRGLTLMEVLLSVALLAIFGVFIMEFLTNMWMASEKDFSRIKCVTAAENILEMAGGLAIAKGAYKLEDTYKRILSNDFVSLLPQEIDTATWTLDFVSSLPQEIDEATWTRDFVSPFPQEIDVATWTLIDSSSPVHPDGVGKYLARIATEANSVSTYSLFVGDAFLANVIEIKSAYSSQSLVVNFGFGP